MAGQCGVRYYLQRTHHAGEIRVDRVPRTVYQRVGRTIRRKIQGSRSRSLAESHVVAVVGPAAFPLGWNTTAGRRQSLSGEENKVKTECEFHLNAPASIATAVGRRRTVRGASERTNVRANGRTDGRSSAINARVPTVRRAGSAAD